MSLYNKVIIFLSLTASRPERLAVDPASRHLFFTDSEEAALYRMDLPNGNNLQVLARTDYKPFALAVDFQEG